MRPPTDIAQLLVDAAEAHGDRIAFEHGGRRWTYRDVVAAARELSGELCVLGVEPGTVVAWIGDNGPEAALAYFGAAMADAILTPLHLRLRPEDLLRILDHAEVALVLCDVAHTERAAALGRPYVVLEMPAPGIASGCEGVAPQSSHPAHLYYTSGSTGVPKGVVLTHENVTTHALLAAQALGLTKDDVWLHAAPMFHLADAWATFAITLVGGVHRFVPKFDVEAVLTEFERGVTVTNLVPTMWNALVRHPSAAGRRYPSLRLLLSGGAAISPDLVRRIRDTLRCEYAQTYGLTETSPYLTISRLTDEERLLPDDEQCRLLAMAGHPMPGVDVRVDLSEGEVGEIVARGPTVTPGYWKNPEANASAFRDGWFHTGDLARVHADGRIDLVDRLNDVINTGGEKVFSFDVERALADFPGLHEVAVVATRDPVWGEVVTAVVVPEGAAPDLAAIQVHARARLADFKIPRRLVLLDALPRTASGKVSKRDVRAAADASLNGRRL